MTFLRDLCDHVVGISVEIFLFCRCELLNRGFMASGHRSSELFKVRITELAVKAESR